MNLIAIYNVWGDSTELLRGSIEQIRDHVDFVLLVAQETSNRGEVDKSVYPFCEELVREGLADDIYYYIPTSSHLLKSETHKRQCGLEYAKSKGFTHFIHLDCDEYYNGSEFAHHKSLIEQHGYDGSACRLYTYYKRPEWRLQHLEKYAVPFIHKLYNQTRTGAKSAYSGFKVDPSRGINTAQRYVMFGPLMHHFSYVRKDIDKKLRNSTARKNIDNYRVRQEYAEAKAGTHLKALFNDTLIEVENVFNIPIWEEEKV